MPAVSEAAPQRGAPVAVCLKLETGASRVRVSVSLTDDGCDDKLDGALDQSEGASL